MGLGHDVQHLRERAARGDLDAHRRLQRAKRRIECPRPSLPKTDKTVVARQVWTTVYRLVRLGLSTHVNAGPLLTKAQDAAEFLHYASPYWTSLLHPRQHLLPFSFRWACTSMHHQVNHRQAMIAHVAADRHVGEIYRRRKK